MSNIGASGLLIFNPYRLTVGELLISVPALAESVVKLSARVLFRLYRLDTHFRSIYIVQFRFQPKPFRQHSVDL